MRILCSLIFVVLMSVITVGSSVVVVFLYLPFVALKAVWMTTKGKARLRTAHATVPPNAG